VLSPQAKTLRAYRKRLRVTKRKAAEAADSRSRHYVSAQYQWTPDKQCYCFFFRLAGKFLLCL